MKISTAELHSSTCRLPYRRASHHMIGVARKDEPMTTTLIKKKIWALFSRRMPKRM